MHVSVITIGGGALAGGVEALARAGGLPGARRRETGSHERGSDDPAAMPVTQWFLDRVPESAPSAPLLVTASGRRALVPLADLDAGHELRAVLDCTGGWWAAQDWRGVRLDALLGATGLDLPAAQDEVSLSVVSATGYRRRLPLRDAPSLLLATHLGGDPLSAGHGAPVRLVAPGRRGYWWVKWVVAVHVDDAPWWAQPPFPPR